MSEEVLRAVSLLLSHVALTEANQIVVQNAQVMKILEKAFKEAAEVYQNASCKSDKNLPQRIRHWSCLGRGRLGALRGARDGLGILIFKINVDWEDSNQIYDSV